MSIAIRHHTDWERFELLESDRVIGKAAYKDYDGGAAASAPEGGDAREPRERIFYHTVVNEEYGGQGLAGKLATEALNQTVAAGLKIVPVCAFIKKFVVKHPEYEAHVVKPTPAHLGFLDDALAQRVRA
ncbi:GNAT family N-acetyltransferase [Arthrobacter sp. SW1]|uniref:GNAT family N-acetyltransferase n=1 Tax=Arthrobacter sp. SW1 TaxID=1920889 RepID=UPI000877DEC6|nr:GNAT family N-acetyltransferase [Arthrobacter sp. SW1]OFI37662.1 GNAT family N-acetyltransferase [Arthrobacter sp. SW1]